MADFSLQWLGHGTFIARYDDRVVLIDPWVANNPVCPDECKYLDKIDLMLITNGHFDHVADAVSLARQHRPQVVGVFELCEWLGKKGVDNRHAMNKGGTIELMGLKITMVYADNTSGIIDDDGSIVYGGEPCGFVLTAPGAPTLYHAGATNVFGDMALIAELYAPDIALLPVGDRFGMGPREAAKAAELLGVERVIPMRFGTFPSLTGDPGQLRELLGGGAQLIELQPGETYRG